MKAVYLSGAVAFALLMTSLDSPVWSRSLAAQERRDAKNVLANLPLMFEVNRGQTDQAVKFFSRMPGYTARLKSSEIEVELSSSHSGAGTNAAGVAGRERVGMRLLGSNPDVRVSGADELPGKLNYFLGNDPSKWESNVPTFAKVRYEEIYPGIDLVFRGSGGQLEYDFVLRPSADPEQIAIDISGAESVDVDQNGALELRTRYGLIRFKRPVSYQVTSGSWQVVQVDYVVARPTVNGAQQVARVSLRLGAYDRSKDLLIDPVLEYSTYLGGSGDDYAAGLARDSSGNVYVVGSTTSLDFPATSGSIEELHAPCSPFCNDIFVAKINSSGNTLLYATYLGGSSDDFGGAIAVDSSGSAYITGTTNSADFPTTSGAVQRVCGGTCFFHDGLVAKLNSTGAVLAYSTYLGGSGEDSTTGIALYQGNAIVGGFSGSSDFPHVTAGAYQTKMQGQGSSFVLQLNQTATKVNYGTFIGEVDLQGAGPAIAVDSSGNSYVTGVTLAPNFPVTSGAFHTFSTANGPLQLTNNLYVSKLNATGSSLVYSALLGGAQGTSIAVDGSGHAYVSGMAGPFAPITPGALNQGCNDGTLVMELSADGSRLLRSANLCPGRLFSGPILALDTGKNPYLVGATDSTQLPTTVGAFRTKISNACCFSDGTLVKLRSDFSSVIYSTYFGGNSSDAITGIALDSSGNAYLGGWTNSTNLPTVNPIQAFNAGSSDVLVAKFFPVHTGLSIAPALINFGRWGIGIRSTTQPITIANIGGSTVAFSSIRASGDFAAFNNCGTKLAPGGHCTANVFFTPTATGGRGGKLTITSTDSGSPQAVLLSGIGVNGPVALLSPTALDFGIQAFNTTSPSVALSLKNVGNADMSISGASLEGPGVGSFNFTSLDTCSGQTLKSGANCRVGFTFTPTFGFGSQSATFTVTDNASDSPQFASLSGIGVNGGGVLFNSVGLKFKERPLSTTSAVQFVRLINAQPSSISISGISISGDFSQSNNCGSILGVGAFCTLNVKFTPTVVGIRQGTLKVTDSGTGSPQVLPLLGTGGPLPTATPSSTSLTFGSQLVGTTSASMILTLSNSSTTPLSVFTVSTTGDFSEKNNCSGGAGPGVTCSIWVQFTPTAAGTRTGTLTISDNASPSQQLITLTGTGTL